MILPSLPTLLLLLLPSALLLLLMKLIGLSYLSFQLRYVLLLELHLLRCSSFNISHSFIVARRKLLVQVLVSYLVVSLSTLKSGSIKKTDLAP